MKIAHQSPSRLYHDVEMSEGEGIIIIIGDNTNTDGGDKLLHTT